MRLALVVVLLAGVAVGQTAESRERNTAGFRLYQAKKYPEALTAFREAIEKDKTNALAHYNLAATLGLLRAAGKVCEFDAYAGTIMAELQEAIALDVKRQARALKDSDFKSVTNTFAWQTAVLKRSVQKDTAAIVTAVVWFSPSVGVYGPSKTIVFKAGGTGVERVLEGDDPRLVDHKIRWKAKAGVVEVIGADGKSTKYTLGADGRLTSEGAVLTDDKGECSA